MTAPYALVGRLGAGVGADPGTVVDVRNLSRAILGGLSASDVWCAVIKLDWNMPLSGKICTRCHDCDGDGVVIVTRAYGSDGVSRSIRAPQTCRACYGLGGRHGLQPPV